MICAAASGNPECSVNGGEFVQRCIGSPITDTSNCTKCRYHPDDDRRSCGLNNYIVQSCRNAGRETSDVSKCAPCRYYLPISIFL